MADEVCSFSLSSHLAGRLFMGDRTYNRMYAENMTMTTVRGAMTPAELTTDSMALVHGADAQEEEEVAQAADAQLAQAGEVQEREQPGPFGALPNWTAPAFMPPYMADGSGPSADHPALHQSPDVTNSSMNTLSTRRVSVDARRQSITSRRFSMADGTSQVFAQPSPGGDSEGGVVMAEPVAAGGDDDDTGDLLADEDDGLNPVGAGFAVIEVGGTDDAGFAVAGPTKTPGAAAASVGRADSSRGPTTGGLLRTGGTTDLLRDTLHHVAPDGPDTFGTHGTTRLLRMDITASSAIGARLPSVGAAPSPIDENAAVGSPANIGAHKMSSSPPPSALTAGSMGRPVSIRASPMVGAPHSVQSARSGAAAGITPSNHRLARTPGSAMALVPAAVSAPGTGAGASGWGPPGSAIAARYPGSAVATGRLSQGFTPSNLPPITFQDFAKLTEVQFLDNLRRGASINYADLQPNAVPTNLAEAYTLLCITSPNVAELETAIHTLQSETARLRASAADLEVMLGQSNPAIFRHVQLASYEQLEALRANVAALKKMCRAKAMALLKDVRCQMEESKACKLARALEGVRTDLAYVQDHAAHMRGVAEAAEKFAAETRAQMAARAQARVVEAERRRKVAAAMAAMAEQRAANEERRRRLEAAMQRAAEVQAERQALKAEHEAAQATADEIRRALSKLAVATGAGGAGSDPRAVLAQLNTVAALERCLGVKVERTGRDASGAVSLVLLVGALFRLRMAWTPAGVRGTVEMVAEAEGKSGAVRRAQRNGESTAALRSLAAAVAGWSRDGGDAFFVDPSSAPAALQAAVARLQRSSDLAAELVGVRLGCPHLAEVSAAPHCGALRVLFTGLDAGIRFAVTLTPGPAYPLGALPHAAQIWYDGEGQVTLADIAHAVARAPAGPGRIRAVCAELSALVERAAPAGPGAYHTNFGNPLFGAVAPGGEGAHAMEIVSAA